MPFVDLGTLSLQNHKNGISYSKGARVPIDDLSAERRWSLNEQAIQAEDVILRGEEQMAEVYFPIEGERYYFVVYLDAEPQVALRTTGMSAGNRVYFFAKSAERPVDELVAIAGVQPTRTWVKGGKRKHILRHNGLEVRPARKDTGEVEE